MKCICNEKRINLNVSIFRANELPNGVNKVSGSGSKINFHKQELIEDCLKSKNIPFNAISGKCIVFKAHENESVDEVLQNYKKVDMLRVCLYCNHSYKRMDIFVSSCHIA